MTGECCLGLVKGSAGFMQNGGPCHTAGGVSPGPRPPKMQVHERRLKSKVVLETSVYHETQPNLEDPDHLPTSLAELRLSATPEQMSMG